MYTIYDTYEDYDAPNWIAQSLAVTTIWMAARLGFGTPEITDHGAGSLAFRWHGPYDRVSCLEIYNDGDCTLWLCTIGANQSSRVYEIPAGYEGIEVALVTAVIFNKTGFTFYDISTWKISSDYTTLKR